MTPPFRVRWHMHHVPRVLRAQAADPVVGVTTTEDGGW